VTFVAEWPIIGVEGRTMSGRLVAFTTVLLVGLGATLLPGAGARAAEPPTFDFETDPQGWVGLGATSSLAVARDAANVKVGQGALEWSYDPRAGDARLTCRPVTVKDGANALEFWLKCEGTGSLELFLVERDGSIYFAQMRPVAGTWHRFRISLADFLQGENRDENGQLDPEQIREIFLQDLSRYQAREGELQPRKLWLDAVTFTPEVAPQRRGTRPVGAALEVLFDDFEDEALGWGGNFRTALSLVKADGRSVLRARYSTAADSQDRLLLTGRFDPRYTRMKSYRVVARATAPVRLSIQLREWDGTYEGPDYEAICEVPAGKEWTTREIPLSALKVTDRKADRNRKLDPETAWLLTIGDASQPAAGPVELEIDSLGVILAQ
jgi:hypothetical protein